MRHAPSNAMLAMYCVKTGCVIRSAHSVAEVAALAIRETIAGPAPPARLSVARGVPTEPLMGIVCRSGSSTAVGANIVRPAAVATVVWAAAPEARGESCSAFLFNKHLPSS